MFCQENRKDNVKKKQSVCEDEQNVYEGEQKVKEGEQNMGSLRKKCVCVCVGGGGGGDLFKSLYYQSSFDMTQSFHMDFDNYIYIIMTAIETLKLIHLHVYTLTNLFLSSGALQIHQFIDDCSRLHLPVMDLGHNYTMHCKIRRMKGNDYGCWVRSPAA